jgi:dolichol-phosphate mannosyltransferase
VLTRRALTVARAMAAGVAIAHVGAAARRKRPIVPGEAVVPPISVVVPARDEALRIAPLLRAVVGAPGVAEVLVVDDESSDGTADVARAAGATALRGLPLPPGWTGKAWALQQGTIAASGQWIVFLDADTRPSPELPRALVARAVADRLDLLTAAGSFECPTPWSRWLHPAMLTTLVYRFAPPGAEPAGAVHRRLGNGQCMAVRRDVLTAAGGWSAVAHHTVEDVAIARTMASAGFAVEFLDATALLSVRMYESAVETLARWSRSLALPGVDPPLRRLAGVGVVAAAQVLPLWRLAMRRADALDALLALVRLGTLAGTATAYRPRGAAYWLSPTADVLALAAVARSAVSRRSRWRGRAYRT